MPEIVYLAKSLDVRRIKFNYLSVVSKATVTLSNGGIGGKIIGFHTFADISGICLLQKEQIDKLEYVLENTKERAASEVKCDLDPVFLNGDKNLLQKDKFPVLKYQIPWRSAAIPPIGDVVQCAMFTDYKMGNMRDLTFDNIWKSEPAKKIRRLLSKGLPPVCQNCCL